MAENSNTQANGKQSSPAKGAQDNPSSQKAAQNNAVQNDSSQNVADQDSTGRNDAGDNVSGENAPGQIAQAKQAQNDDDNAQRSQAAKTGDGIQGLKGKNPELAEGTQRDGKTPGRR